MAVTIKTIAEHFGVSLSTASRALNDSGYVKKALRDEIKAYAKENKWYPSNAAVSMAKGKNKTIAFLINKLSNHINSILLEQVVISLRKDGFHVFVSQFLNPEEQEKELESYLYFRPYGVIVFPLVMNEQVDDILDQLLENGTKVVAMGARKSEHCAAVSFDFYSQGFEMMQHLLARGHKRISFFGAFSTGCIDDLLKSDEGNKLLSIKQLKGSIESGKHAGVSFDPERDIVSDDNLDDLKEVLIAKTHTAFICSNVRLLTLFYRICAELNIKIGEDVSVVALGDNPVLDGFSPRPDCFEPNSVLLGKTVAELILKASTNAEKITIPPVYVAGNSVKNIE